MDRHRRQQSISLCQPHSTTPDPSQVGVPTWLPDALGCRPSAVSDQGATLSTFPQVRLTREPTCTQAIDPGTSGSTLRPADTSRPSRSSGHFPDFPWPGSTWLAHSSPLHGDWFSKPTGLLPGAFGLPSHPMFRVASSCHRPNPHVLWFFYPPGLLCGPIPPLIPCFYLTGPPATVWRGPTGSSSIRGPFRAPSTGRSLPAPAPFPYAASRHPPWLTPRFPRLPDFLGPSCGPSHTPSSVLSPFLCIPFFFPGCQLPSAAGPLDPHPSRDRFVCLALVAPFPPPFRLCDVLRSGPAVGPSSWPPRPPLPMPFPHLFFVVLFFRATRGLSSVLLLRSVPPPPARFVPHALVRRCGVLFFSLCFCRASCLVVPSSLHARTTTPHRPSVSASFGALFLSLRPPVGWP